MSGIQCLDLHASEWVILFGGGGREHVIIQMHEAAIPIVQILVPKKKNARLAASIKRLYALDLPVVDVARDTLDDILRPLTTACLLSLGFPYIIPCSIYSRHRLALNVHPTLLPKYRGPTTGAYVLMNREPVSGSTVHLMSEEVDGGDILAQNSVPLSPFDTIRSLQRKIYAAEAQLVLGVLYKLEEGIYATPQLESEASEYPRFRTPSDSRIDPERPLTELVDHIRACDPDDFPAFFWYEGEKLCVKLWRPEKHADEFDML